ncbi:MAG TPA: thiamine-phosphate kinase [Pyrinomonadaceae bacterium]|nr:thiamine-phosphate kinase [Pyrinomonadaceae bacterium]
MNEFDRIKQIRALAEARNRDVPGLVRGIGDDAAVIKSFAGTDVVISTDLLVEGIDFRRDTTRPDLLGHKALAVSLSDIAAMGSRPRWALLSIGVPEAVWNSSFIDQFYKGFFRLADRYAVKLIGGDLSRTPQRIIIDSIVVGECPVNRELFRSGAKPGDHIYVTGFLGDAAAGLRLIERGTKLPEDRGVSHPVDNLLLHQLQPEPRVGWGLLLGEKQLATAMIDISDGLSSDLHHLCEESGVGAVVDASRLPIDEVVSELCGRRALDPLMLALHGGEDFELLFTVSPEKISQLPSRVDGVAITRIGVIGAASEGVRISEGSRVWKLEPGGWEHFRKDEG